MRNVKKPLALLTGILLLGGVMLTAGCNSDSGSKTDQEAAQNAGKAPTKDLGPVNAKKTGMAPPPP